MSTPTARPRSRAGRFAVALVSLAPVVAVGALAYGTGVKSVNDVELASDRALATQSSLVCPGPMVSAQAGAASSSDAQFQAQGPATRMGMRAVSIEPHSHVLFGRAEVSQTQLQDSGEPIRPSLSAQAPTNTDVPIEVVEGAADFVTAGAFGLEHAVTVNSSSFEGIQPVVDAVQATQSNDGDYRGLSVTRCPQVGVHGMFVGISTAPGDEASVVLTNPGDRAARASLTVFDSQGLLEGASGSDVIVPAGSTERVSVQALSPQRERIALEVRVEGSALAMHVEASERDGLAAHGTESVESQQPSTRQVIPGLALGSGRTAEIVVANSYRSPADVRVSILDERGVGVGEPLALLGIGSGALAHVPINAPEGMYTLVIESDVPVASSARITLAGAEVAGSTAGAVQDFAILTPAPAITNSSLMALGLRGSGGTLVLHAREDTSVSVLALTAQGQVIEGEEFALATQASVALSAEQWGVDPAEVVAFVIVPSRAGIVHGSWIQTVSAGNSGGLISAVSAPDNNVAAAGVDVFVRP